MQTAQATTTAWIVASTPVFIAILGWLVLKEKFSLVRIAGIVLAALGVLIVVSKGDVGALVTGREGTIGDLLIFISAINWAVYTVLSRRELGRHPAARMMFYVMLFGWLFTTVWIFGFGPGMREMAGLSFRAWAAILVLGVFGSGLAYIAYYDSLQALPASQLGAFLNIEPLVTTLLAAAMINEPITAVTLIGGAVIILGVYLVNRKASSRRRNMNLMPRASQGSSVEPIPEGWKLSIPAGNTRQYRLAQLDNCTRVSRRDFPYRSLEMRLRARVSSGSVPGTWGFGAWNDPYRIAFGPGETIFSALTLPNAAWFFSSSEKSHLSFRDDKPGNGFLAQVFSSQRAPLPALARLAGIFLFSRVRGAQGSQPAGTGGCRGPATWTLPSGIHIGWTGTRSG